MRPYQLFLAIPAVFAAIFLLSDRAEPVLKGVVDGSLVAGLTGGSGGGRAARQLGAADDGKRLASPGIALVGGGVADVTDVASFFEPTREDETPAVTVAIPEVAGCSFRAPRQGEVIGNVHVARGGLPVRIAALSAAWAADSALGQIRAARTGGEAPAFQPPRPMRAVDVFVTETAAPVYLILQSGDGDVLWNLQPTPGARIAHVAVVAAGEAGVVVPEGLGSVEVLRSAVQPACAIRPARQPDAGWGIVRSGAARIEDLTAAYESYDTWFRARFGIGAADGLVGFAEAAHVLIGPVPPRNEKVLQARLEGARIAFVDPELVAIGPDDVLAGRTAGFVDALARRAAGGDLAALRFAPQRRME